MSDLQKIMDAPITPLQDTTIGARSRACVGVADQRPRCSSGAGAAAHDHDQREQNPLLLVWWGSKAAGAQARRRVHDASERFLCSGEVLSTAPSPSKPVWVPKSSTTSTGSSSTFGGPCSGIPTQPPRPHRGPWPEAHKTVRGSWR